MRGINSSSSYLITFRPSFSSIWRWSWKPAGRRWRSSWVDPQWYHTGDEYGHDEKGDVSASKSGWQPVTPPHKWCKIMNIVPYTGHHMIILSQDRYHIIFMFNTLWQTLSLSDWIWESEMNRPVYQFLFSGHHGSELSVRVGHWTWRHPFGFQGKVITMLVMMIEMVMMVMVIIDTKIIMEGMMMKLITIGRTSWTCNGMNEKHEKGERHTILFRHCWSDQEAEVARLL